VKVQLILSIVQSLRVLRQVSTPNFDLEFPGIGEGAIEYFCCVNEYNVSFLKYNYFYQ